MYRAVSEASIFHNYHQAVASLSGAQKTIRDAVARDRVEAPGALGREAHGTIVPPKDLPGHAANKLLRDPATRKPPVLWGHDAARALHTAVTHFTDDDFAMVLATLPERLTPEFVVHVLSVTPADSASPRWQSCLARLMPYIIRHTRDIERTPTFVQSSLMSSCVRGVVDALEAWMRVPPPAVSIEVLKRSRVLGRAPTCKQSNLLFLSKELPDAIRFYVEYSSDEQFSSVFLISAVLGLLDHARHADTLCRVLPAVARRNRSWVDSRLMQPFVLFAQQHGMRALLDAYARRQKVALAGLCLAGPRAMEDSIEAYGPHFVAALLRGLAADLPEDICVAAGARAWEHEIAAIASVGALLHLDIDALVNARRKQRGYASSDSEADTDTRSQDIELKDHEDAGTAAATGCQPPRDRAEPEIASAKSANDTDSSFESDTENATEDTRMYSWGELAAYRYPSDDCCDISSSSEDAPYEDPGDTDAQVAKDPLATPRQSLHDEPLDRLQGEEKFARELLRLAEAQAEKGHMEVVLKCVEHVHEIEDESRRVDLWHRMVRKSVVSPSSDTLAPAVLGAIPKAYRETVVRHDGYSIVRDVFSNALTLDVDAARCFEPQQVHAFLKERRAHAVDLLSLAVLPWKVMERLAAALDEAGRLTLLDILRDAEAKYLF